MNDRRWPKLETIIAVLAEPPIDPSISRKVKEQTAQARAALAEKSATAPPKPSAKDAARSAAVKRGHTIRPKSVAMAEIGRKHFPKWYRDNVRDGELPRGIRDSFAQEMVELFAERGVKISAGGVRNNIPEWIDAIEGASSCNSE